jgi:hypothetical protein
MFKLRSVYNIPINCLDQRIISIMDQLVILSDSDNTLDIAVLDVGENNILPKLSHHLEKISGFYKISQKVISQKEIEVKPFVKNQEPHVDILRPHWRESDYVLVFAKTEILQVGINEHFSRFNGRISKNNKPPVVGENPIMWNREEYKFVEMR